MTEILLPVDIEVCVVNELTTRMSIEEFQSVDIGTKIANPMPAEFVRVRALGGVQRDFITDTPTVAIEGFSASETRAHRLVAFALGSLQAAAREGRIGSAVCYGVSVFSLPANLPAPTVPDRARFTVTVSVATRKATA